MRSGRVGRFVGAALLSLAAGTTTHGADSDEFRIGMVAEGGSDRSVAGLSVIRAAFARATGKPVQVFVARDYAALIEAQVAGRLDYAIYSAPAYAAASLRCGCLRPVVAPVDADGAVGVRSVLIARRGAAEPARIAIGPADSLTGRLAPLSAWPPARAAQDLFVEAASASAAERMFLDGEVDAFFGWVPARRKGGDEASGGGSLGRLADAGIAPGDIEVRWRSAVLRYGPHAVHADVGERQSETLARMLRHAAVEQPDLHLYLERLHGGGFESVGQGDYAAAIAAIAVLDAP